MSQASTEAFADNASPSKAPSASRSVGLAEPVCFVREFRGEFNRQQVVYRVIAAETYVRDEKSVPVASFFSFDYLKSDVEDASARPVTFVFNGGPGSSAQWLHMGGLGPRRVEMPADPINAGAAPYTIVDNPLSILDVTDLVFVDPVGTGYSRALSDKDPKQFWGVLQDARSIADFIGTWITEHKRWNSRKYLAGESYGTVRACLLAELLSNRYIALNGIVLIAPVLDYQNSRPRPGDGGILSYASFLPSYAATARYHRRLTPDDRTLESLLDEVRSFARTDYVQALVANDHRLTHGERTRLVSRLAAYTGLKESYVAQSRLRVPVERFFKELLRDRSLVVGRLDGRYTGVEPESAGEFTESDPAFDAFGSAFTTAMQVQLEELGVRMERPYVSMAGVLESWNWLLQERAPSGGGYVNVVPQLGRAMRRNPDLRVLVACGYYDLTTPFFGAENALSQDGVVHERLAYRYYESGHMIFLDGPSRIRMLDDVRGFIRGESTCPEVPDH